MKGRDPAEDFTRKYARFYCFFVCFHRAQKHVAFFSKKVEIFSKKVLTKREECCIIDKLHA